MQIRRVSGFINANERLVSILLLINRDDLGGRHRFRHPEIDRLEDAAVDRNQLRGKAELVLFQSAGEQNFRYMAMLQNRIRGKVLGRLAEAGLEGGLAS